jgi:hypothetical protein
MVLGTQHVGVAGLPIVVAATFVYSMEVQLPDPTAKGSAVRQVSFAGWA